MNVIARLEYELAYYDSAAHRFNHYTTRTLPPCIVQGTFGWFRKIVLWLRDVEGFWVLLSILVHGVEKCDESLYDFIVHLGIIFSLMHFCMVLNQTNFQFSTTKMEALSLGLKFATGIFKNITTNSIVSDYWNSDIDFSKGIILAAVSQPKDSSLPKHTYIYIYKRGSFKMF